ncbi:hypothetical protein DY000_02045534 [Brassica cretica]|uniref:Reverse transcriptase zinc-binding domain-containing protein n=1 Tax=Brassica cretica TaxID=69181 RepID=A0ABQ7F5K9_BRACR|nr:hypothetical protein DY000_02045534 [Brassica cretica]
MDARISYYEPILALAKAKEEKAFALQKSWLPASEPEMTKSKDRIGYVIIKKDVFGLVGEPKETDDFTLNLVSLSLSHVKVEVDLTKPLPRVVEFTRQSGEVVEVQVDYPWLPATCSHCKELRHVVRNCLNIPPPPPPSVADNKLKGKAPANPAKTSVTKTPTKQFVAKKKTAPPIPPFPLSSFDPQPFSSQELSNNHKTPPPTCNSSTTKTSFLSPIVLTRPSLQASSIIASLPQSPSEKPLKPSLKRSRSSPSLSPSLNPTLPTKTFVSNPVSPFLHEGPSNSWLANKLIKYRDLVFPLIKRRLGNGLTTNFWFDNWSPFGSLTNFLDGSTRRLGIPKTATVASLFVGENWLLPPAMTDNQLTLQIYLTTVNLSAQEDSYAWEVNGKTSLKFKTGEIYTYIIGPRPTLPWSAVVWCSYGIPRQSFLAWLLDRSTGFAKGQQGFETSYYPLLSGFNLLAME